MIFDQLGNAQLYRTLHPRLAAAFDYLDGLDPATPDGVHELAGDNLVARVQSYQTISEKEQSWESHRSYIDLQAVLSGEEQILWSQIDQLDGATRYDETKDLVNYAVSRGEPLRLTLRHGDFAIFFPHDGHKPGLSIAAPVAVRKVVVKIAVW